MLRAVFKRAEFSSAQFEGDKQEKCNESKGCVSAVVCYGINRYLQT